MVLDYCFIRDGADEDLLTVCVGRLYPYRAIFIVPCDVKGADAHAIDRFCAFLTACGVERLNYMCDQESAINSMIKQGLAKLGKH